MRGVHTLARAACALLLAVAGTAFAQAFPSKPITVIVPYSAGGVTDVIARNLGQQVSESVGQPVVVVNRPGGNAIIGMQACATAAPDGHTVCLTVGDSVVYNPLLYTSLPYDPVNDFAPVSLLAWSTSMLVAGPQSPVGNWKELLQFAKANPGKLNYGTWGPATTPDLYLQWIKHSMGLNITAVPYKGAGQANPALLAGEIDMTLYGVGNAQQFIKAGKFKPIAVFGNQRSPLLPDVPSLGELGADPDLSIYFCLFAPSKTPRPVIDRLNAEFVKALRSPRGQAMVAQFTLRPEGSSPDEFARTLEKDRAAATRVFTTLGIKPSAQPSQ